jgi:hypothetical protein
MVASWRACSGLPTAYIRVVGLGRSVACMSASAASITALVSATAAVTST